VRSYRASGKALPVVGLLGGDMMRTLGGTGDPARFTGTEPIPHLPVDIVVVTADDVRHSLFVSHLVARRPWWRGGWLVGPLTVAMNAEFIGRWDLSPRAHPNDGRIDLVSAGPELTLQQRWLARSRLPLGTHVPHPSIGIRQHAAVTVDLGRARPIWLDGRRWGRARTLQMTVEPDALVICV